MELKDAKIAIIGLGYVGLPLAVEFSKKYPVIGFDVNKKRIDELSNGYDLTLEISKKEIADAQYLTFTSNRDYLKKANIFIVTVPTPIDSNKKPELTPLIKASELIGCVISKGDIVIYESTVYPGATEDDCIPIIEEVSGLKFNQDFYAGYSPERINPGDKQRRVKNILKVTSGSTPEIAEFVNNLYGEIITAGTYKASCIKVAEAAKVIENVQRDVNIALINEFHQIFNNMGIDTNEVIEAAATKWNFMKLKPGLVGGHCISIDPYYLLYKSERSGYIPDLIRTSREINDHMPSYIATDFMRSLIKEKINPVDLEVAVFGFSFKENCPDIRNTKIYDLYRELVNNNFKVKVYDEIVDYDDVLNEYGIEVINNYESCTAQVIILAVPHDGIIEKLKNSNVKYIYDFKGILN